MENEAFPRRVVERSFRKFGDAVSDLIGSNFQAWEELLRCLIEFCETDRVMKVVIEPLSRNANVNMEAWYAEFQESVGGMIGSGRYSLPNDDEDRTALYYQFLKALSEGRIPSDFAVDAYGLTDFQEMVAAIDREFVRKFAREVKYRLQEVVTETRDQQEVSRQALTVFNHYHGPVQQFENIQNSLLTTGDLLGNESRKVHDQRVTVGDVTNSNLAAHTSHSSQNISTPSDVNAILSQISAILQTDNSITKDDRDDAMSDVESLKNQIAKKSKDLGTITRIVNTLEKVGRVASLATKLLEMFPATN